MAKREFLMLAHEYSASKYVNGWMMSEKLDGIRAFWDGGVSTGVATSLVPWANTAKDKKATIATGLWSRYGKVIYAPNDWLEQLPKRPLDGELWLGRRQWQTLSKIVKEHNPGVYWGNVRYLIFDTPSLETVLAPGVIDDIHFKKHFFNCIEWAKERGNLGESRTFEFAYLEALKNCNSGICSVVEQEQLPLATIACRARIEEKFSEIQKLNGEGLIFRNPASRWSPERSHNLLKYKPESDAEGTVIGYTWGRKTDKGSRLMGKMGALILNYNGKKLKISGFEDSQRVMISDDSSLSYEERLESAEKAGEEFQDEEAKGYSNPKFPIGLVVSFKYRELSDTGIPKEARFFRIP